MLRCEGIVVEFGGVRALDGMGFTIEPGEVLGLIGPNGSGKSTLVNVVSGFITPIEGSVTLDDVELSRLSPAEVRRAGVARTFQNLRLIDELTVFENVLIGLHLHFTQDRLWYWQWVPAMFSLPGSRRRSREAEERAMDALARLDIADKARERVRDLSYGDRKRIELARVLTRPPRVLLLDEPTAGLEPREGDELVRKVIETVGADGTCHVILIEHRLDLVVGVSDRVVVCDGGRKIAEGQPAEVAADPEVVRIYVGGPEA